MRVQHGDNRPGSPVAAVISRVVAIINPTSGAGLDGRAATTRSALVRAALAERGLSGTVHVTERAGHARELATAAVAEGADLVIVWGGDGTVNEAGAALVGSTTALGLVPAGSGNGLAASLCVPRDPAAALDRILSAPSAPWTSASSASVRSSMSPASALMRTSPRSSTGARGGGAASGRMS